MSGCRPFFEHFYRKTGVVLCPGPLAHKGFAYSPLSSPQYGCGGGLLNPAHIYARGVDVADADKLPKKHHAGDALLQAEDADRMDPHLYRWGMEGIEDERHNRVAGNHA